MLHIICAPPAKKHRDPTWSWCLDPLIVGRVLAGHNKSRQVQIDLVFETALIAQEEELHAMPSRRVTPYPLAQRKEFQAMPRQGGGILYEVEEKGRSSLQIVECRVMEEQLSHARGRPQDGKEHFDHVALFLNSVSAVAVGQQGRPPP